MAKTTIDWTAVRRGDILFPGYTLNGWIGCAKVGPECKFCYAERVTEHFGQWDAEWGINGRRHISKTAWLKPFGWEAYAKVEDVRLRVFVESMGDLFEERDDLNPYRDRIIALIHATPGLDYLLVTKRPQFALQYFASPSLASRVNARLERIAELPQMKNQTIRPFNLDFQNIWFGITAGTQESADSRREVLRAIPAAKRFVSCEPTLGQIDWQGYEFIDWMITGGESGADESIRPSHVNWFRQTRDWALSNQIAIHHKQNGEWLHESQITADQQKNATRNLPSKAIHSWADGSKSYFIGRNKTGDLLDGVSWKQSPGGTL